MLKMILAATLLLTSLSSIGLVSVWAARSSKHWFLRAAVFVAVVSILLLIPAYEPLVAFSVQGAVVAIGIQLARWQRRNLENRELGRSRVLYSLLTCLLVTAFLAIATAVAMRLPNLGFDAWRNVVLIGVASGVATLLGVWVVASQKSRWWLSLTAALVVCLGMSLVLWRFDFFLASVVDDYSLWPSIDEDLIAWFGTSVGSYEMLFSWACIIAGVMMATIAVVRLMTAATKPAETKDGWLPRHSSRKRMARCALLMIISSLFVPPAYVYMQLVTPLPIPSTEQANPNGWLDLVEAGRMVEASSAKSTIDFYDTSSPKQLATAVRAMKPVYERFDRGMQQPVHYQPTYDEDDINVDIPMGQRALGRALSSRGRLAEVEDRFHDAADSYLDTIRFGFATRRGGLMIHSLVGIACSGEGRSHLYHCRGDLSLADCWAFASALEQIENESEPAQGFVDRDRLWAQHAFGWYGHLDQILDDFSAPKSERIQSSFLDACDREIAEMRLLRIELAIQAWRNSLGRLPSSLDELIPEYITEVPVDPMSGSGAGLQFRQVGDGYLLYSVGRNGIDDGGDAPESDLPPYEHGDLRLDVLYATSP